MFPLSSTLLPGEVIPLHVFEPRYRALMADCLGGEREFGVVLIKRGSEVGGGDERFVVGTLAYVAEGSRFPDGRLAILVRGLRPIEVVEWLPDDPYPVALVIERPVSTSDSGPLLDQAERAVRRVLALLSELGQATTRMLDLLPDDPDERAWALGAVLPVNPLDSQGLLEVGTHLERLSRIIELADATAEDLSRLLAGG